MAKRFVDTGILKHHFTRSLPAPYKLLWVHLLTDCNHAGMWQVDWDIAEIIIGSKIDRKKAEQLFDGKVAKIKNGAIWFLPDFIDFQYGRLSEKNQAHKGIIAILLKENLIESDLSIKPLPRGCQGAGIAPKDKDKEKEKDKEEEKEKAGFENFEVVEHPYLTKIKTDYKILLRMKEPLTEDEANRLESEIGDLIVYDLLERMANWKKITSNNVSVNRTLRTWYKKDFEKNGTTNDKPERKFGRLSESSIRNVFNRPDLPLPD